MENLNPEVEDDSADSTLSLLRKILVTYVFALMSSGCAFLFCAITSSNYSMNDVSIALFLANISHLTSLRHKDTWEYAKKISLFNYATERAIAVTGSVLIFFAFLAPWFPRMVFAFTLLGIFSLITAAIIFRLRVLGTPLLK